jgi:signal transduction histidine kinase
MIDMVAYCLKDQDQRTWFATFRGLFRSMNNDMLPLPGLNNVAYYLLEIGKDSMLVGTVNGVLLLHNNRNILTNAPPLLQKSTITCMYKMNRTVWIGSDNGLFSYQLDRKKFQFHSANSPFTFISNISPFPNRNQLILGTPIGLALLNLNNNVITDINPGIGLQPLAVEMYSMHVDKKRKLLWFGTEEGVFTCNYEGIKNPEPLSKVILTSVLCDGAVLKAKQWNEGVSNWYSIPQSLKLPAEKSRLSFEFKAISLRDNEGIEYQYRIVGLNDKWSTFSKDQKLEFAALNPGNYTIEIKAKSRDGQFAKQPLSYSFSILPRFYETLWFKALILVLTLIIGGAIQYMFTTIRKKSKERMELALKEEREIVRRRTAEDFHDELGSRLIRIRLFLDVLVTKISASDQEAFNLITQIKENSTQLFQSARDIIWSLNPESDNLYEVLSRVCDFSSEMFKSTGTLFREIGVDELERDIFLPLEYSRNITMTLKEALTNSFKHAHASEVILSIERIDEQEWLIRIQDNGIGYDIKTVELGSGINNINTRAKRINANLTISSQMGKGSSLELRFKLPIK